MCFFSIGKTHLGIKCAWSVIFTEERGEGERILAGHNRLISNFPEVLCVHPLAGTWEAQSSASLSIGMPWFYSNEPSEGLVRVSAQKGGVVQGQVSLCAGIWLLTPGGMKVVKYPSILLNIAAELNLEALWSDSHTDFWLKHHFSPIFWSSYFLPLKYPKTLWSLMSFSSLCSSLDKQKVLFPSHSWEMDHLGKWKNFV